MKWLGEIFIQTICSLVIIFMGHQIYDHIKNKFSKKVVKEMYYTQADKYKDLMLEIQNEEERTGNMENELNQFLEESIKQPPNQL